MHPTEQVVQPVDRSEVVFPIHASHEKNPIHCSSPGKLTNHTL